MVTQWTFSHHFKQESLSPLSIMKHFCELFLEQIFNFHELTGLITSENEQLQATAYEI